MNKVILNLFLIFFLSGCAAISNIEEIKVLQSFSDEVEETDAYVDAYDEAFYRLIVAIENHSIDLYPDKNAIIREFTEPIQKVVIMRNGQPYERWLYRRSVYFFNSAKVYLIFDKNDHLVEHIYEPIK